MANGYPIAAAVGRSELQAPASRVFLTGSFWNSPAEMAAALSTIAIIERDGVIPTLADKGSKFCAGLLHRANEAGVEISVSGPPALPFMRFVDDNDYSKRRAFASYCFSQGVFFHPNHNWFLCAAHTDEDIGVALQVAGEGFATASGLGES